MRRAPQPHERSAAARAKDADRRMRGCKKEEREALLRVLKANKHCGVEEVGQHDKLVDCNGVGRHELEKKLYKGLPSVPNIQFVNL